MRDNVRMLIVLGGLKGSGRRTLAKELARQRGYHWYDTNRHRMRGHFFKKDGALQEYFVGVYGDIAHAFVLQKVVDDLPLLSKIYPDTVLDYSFTRRAARDYFLAEAAKYFSPVLFIWVDANESRVQARLQRIGAHDPLRLNFLQRRRERAAREYEPVGPSALIFINEDTRQESAARLSELINGGSARREKSLSGS